MNKYMRHIIGYVATAVVTMVVAFYLGVRYHRTNLEVEATYHSFYSMYVLELMLDGEHDEALRSQLGNLTIDLTEQLGAELAEGAPYGFNENMKRLAAILKDRPELMDSTLFARWQQVGEEYPVLDR